jgi:hypothetical protein
LKKPNGDVRRVTMASATLTIEVSGRTFFDLAVQAQDRGVSIGEYVRQLLTQHALTHGPANGTENRRDHVSIPLKGRDGPHVD